MSHPLVPADRLLQPAQRWVLLAVGLVLFAAGLLLHGSGLNARLMLLVHASASSAVSAVFWSCLTVAGLGWAAVIVVLAADRGAGRLATLLVPTFVAGSLLTHVPKSLFISPRPAGTALLSQLHVIGDVFRGPASMPSGHSVTALATAMLLWTVVPRARAWSVGLPILAVGLLIACSRVVVGAHWPADVLAGAALGVVAAAFALVLAALEPTRRLGERLAAAIGSRAGQRWIAALEIAAAAGLLAERTGYPDGKPMVWLLAAVAVASALQRLRPRAAATPASLPSPGAASAERR